MNITKKLFLKSVKVNMKNTKGIDLKKFDLRGCDEPIHKNVEYFISIGSDLIDANLQGANLKKSTLKCANLENANLLFSDLEGADLSSANLSFSNLRDRKSVV